MCFVFHRPQHRDHTMKVCQKGMRELSTHPEKPRFPVTKLMAYGEGGSGGEPGLKQKNNQYMTRLYFKFFTNTSRSRRVNKRSHARRQSIVDAGGEFKSTELARSDGERSPGESSAASCKHEGHTRALVHVPTTPLSSPEPPGGQRERSWCRGGQEPSDTEHFAKV